jgi:hypothetical protein
MIVGDGKGGMRGDSEGPGMLVDVIERGNMGRGKGKDDIK